jgi:hypothetical protein
MTWLILIDFEVAGFGEFAAGPHVVTGGGAAEA